MTKSYLLFMLSLNEVQADTTLTSQFKNNSGERDRVDMGNNRDKGRHGEREQRMRAKNKVKRTREVSR